MKIAFDIDGTLTIPAIKNLANALHNAGHDIYIITGGLRKPHEDHKIGTRTKHRRAQLKELGVTPTKLFVCVGITTEEVAREKALICNDAQIELIFEDSRLYIDTIRKCTKTIVVDVKN